VARQIARTNGQRFLPILPISIFQLNRNRRSDCLPVADARKNVRPIALNLHTPTTSVTLLPPPQFAVDKRLIHC
jgi:hypothetical protein